VKLYQNKKFLPNKGNNYQNEERTFRMGENFASCSSDRELISRIYKEVKKLNNKRTYNPINKWATEVNKQCSKGVPMAN
jgi:hypothetical protein